MDSLAGFFQQKACNRKISSIFRGNYYRNTDPYLGQVSSKTFNVMTLSAYVSPGSASSSAPCFYWDSFSGCHFYQHNFVLWARRSFSHYVSPHPPIPKTTGPFEIGGLKKIQLNVANVHKSHTFVEPKCNDHHNYPPPFPRLGASTPRHHTPRHDNATSPKSPS